jgi:hypothetical protein
MIQRFNPEISYLPGDNEPHVSMVVRGHGNWVRADDVLNTYEVEAEVRFRCLAIITNTFVALDEEEAKELYTSELLNWEHNGELINEAIVESVDSIEIVGCGK